MGTLKRVTDLLDEANVDYSSVTQEELEAALAKEAGIARQFLPRRVTLTQVQNPVMEWLEGPGALGEADEKKGAATATKEQLSMEERLFLLEEKLDILWEEMKSKKFGSGE